MSMAAWRPGALPFYEDAAPGFLKPETPLQA
jgi:hypothetical protein